jgi:TolB-like protein
VGESTKAVFLSYASQDASAARRICDALRAAGLDVWFDQSELRGGDAWDASIRRQIRECALFVPVISANTQAREEGYFRREWNLAVDRTLDMAHDKAFLLPVVIDGTTDAVARIPDKFRSVQWTRLPDGEAAESFAAHARRLLGGVVALAGAAPSVPSPTSNAAAQPSIAVLPFVNMSRDEENEYFADGLSEELLNVLAKIRGIRVASRTSAFHFKGKDVDIPTVAKKLNVATILEGSVRKSGKRVRITAQLIEVATDSHLWSETYDRELDDIFAVQDDIAQSVVKELRAALLGERIDAAANAEAKAEVKAAAVGRADDPEAYRLYMLGSFHLERMTREGTTRALDYFQQALAIDPDFALGWVGVSRANNLMAGYGWGPLAECVEKARAAAQRSLTLAPDLAEAHVALANVYSTFDFDWKAADAELQRALALAPGSTLVLRAVAQLAGTLGRVDEAVEIARKVAALDPLSAGAQRLVASRCFYAGRLDEAEAALHKARELDPNTGLVHIWAAAVYLLQGRFEESLAAAERELLPDFRLVGLALAHHSLGHAAAAAEVLNELIAQYGSGALIQIAIAFAWRDEHDKAWEWLERAYAARDPGLGMTAIDPILRRLNRDARWEPFLRKLGLG